MQGVPDQHSRAWLRAGFAQRLAPKLRMVANGDTDVNALRAEHSAAVAVPPPVAKQVPPRRAAATTATAPSSSLRRKLTGPANAVVSLFVQLDDDRAAEGLNATPLTAVRGLVGTAELPVAKALELAASERVAFAELGQPLILPVPDPATGATGATAAPGSRVRRVGGQAQHRDGAGALVGLVDVGGFDFAHPDFLDRSGATRFLRIWDQGGAGRPSPARRGTAPFDYGAELLGDELNAALRAAGQGGLPATELEPQSSMAVGSHATHVASIAAGNRGVCRKSGIVAVLIAVPEDELSRRESFYDSTRLAHAVDYLLAVADELQRPISINISLGTNGHAHDDSAPVNRWIDASLTSPGRCVCAAAGNAGQERAESDDDIGWIMGRVHTSGQVSARELVSDIAWTVVGDTISDLSENELEIWYGPEDRLAVQVKPPGGAWTELVRPGQFIQNRELADGTVLSVYNELYHPANGSNLIAVYLSPTLRQDELAGVAAGEWIVRLHGEEIRNGRYDGWIERDDPRRIGRFGGRERWVFPSFFSESSFVDESTVSTLACAQRVISVANLDADARRIAITSSQGPTRDRREKPDVAAPGTNIVAAKGFAGPSDRWVAMSGTSMASPYIAGLAGLMLSANPTLTAAQIGGILRRTARPLPGNDFRWRDDAGAGAVDADRCIAEAASARARTELR